MNKLNITLTGRIPAKKNQRQLITVRGRAMTIPSKKYKEWHEEKMWEIKQFVPDEPIALCKRIDIKFWFPDNRRTDLSNKKESIMDLLVDAGVLVDDCWQVTGQTTDTPMGIDKENPRAEIVIVY